MTLGPGDGFIERDRDMLVVTNYRGEPNQFDGKIERHGTNKPELRQKLIHDHLLERGYRFHVPWMGMTENDLVDLGVHDSDYLCFLRNAYTSYVETPDSDYERPDGIIPYHFSRHDGAFDVGRQQLPYWKQMGYYGDDVLTPINGDTYKIAMQSANNCYVAGQLIDGDDAGADVGADADAGVDIIYCLNTYPGHHATHRGYSGYCYLNNAYVCAGKLVKDGHRVAVLDVDYHAGTHDVPVTGFRKNARTNVETLFRVFGLGMLVLSMLIWGMSSVYLVLFGMFPLVTLLGAERIYPIFRRVFPGRIMTISIHADPRADYPTFSGFEEENTAENKNIIFPPKATWAEYSVCLARALDQIRRFDPDVVVVPFGGDTYKEDGDASKLYGCALELDDYVKMGRMIGGLGKKVVVTQEGGYCMEKMPQIVDNLLTGLSSGMKS